MTSTARPTLYRRPDHRVLGGVASGIADHIGVSARWIRLVFIVLTLTGGLGVVLYGAYWIVLPTPPGAMVRSRFPPWFEYVVAVVSAVVALAIVNWGIPLGQLFVPAILACLGAALIWRQATESQRAHWWRLSRDSLAARSADGVGRARLAAGLAMVVLGGVVVLARADISAARDGLVAMAVTAVGIGLITGPWWMRTVAELAAERRARIRSQEHAELAAHLHDSVLQTLALIQRNASSPREVARLARGQERELRALLYGEPAARGQFADALQAVAAEVEDAYAVTVEVVVVGDAALDDQLTALVAASREALVNAAKHARVTTVSLYAEIEEDSYTAFIKDRGVGFHLSGVAADRQGVRGSILARVERHGGEARVRSSPGEGTEIEIRMVR
jgi:signal transduction histidine kinase